MTAVLFLAFVLLVALSLVTIFSKYLPTGSAISSACVLLAWLAWVGFLGLSGSLADLTSRPPAIVYIIGPLMAFMLLVLTSRWGSAFSIRFPIRLLLGAQVFRVVVEILLHLLWQDGQIPRMLTWDGSNFDVLIGLTAPLAAWAAARGRAGRLLAQAWTVAGILMLANVVVRSALTAPGPLQLLGTEVPNQLPGQFPYVYLVGFLAPLALLLHLMAIRTWLSAQDTDKASVLSREGLPHGGHWLDNRIPPPLVFTAFASLMGMAAWLLPGFGEPGWTGWLIAAAFFTLASLTGPTAVRRFIRAKTTINPVAIDQASVLVTDGVYRWTRNPMYLSMAALLAAFAAVSGQAWLWLGPVLFATYIQRFQIRPEERVMTQLFGDAYRDYVVKVRPWI